VPHGDLKNWRPCGFPGSDYHQHRESSAECTRLRAATTDIETAIANDPIHSQILLSQAGKVGAFWPGEDQSISIQPDPANGAATQLLFRSPIKTCHGCADVGGIYIG
jgi:hypothetical protein